MDTGKIIRSQYLAALEMLKQVIVKCPEALWGAPGDENSCWIKAYHSLFYTHLYLQKEEADFKPWHKQHAEGDGTPYTRAEILEYLAFTQQVIQQQTAQLDLEAPSGFHWIPFNKLELQFYNIRHIQQHAGELFERLGSNAKIELDWVSLVRDSNESSS